MPTTALPASHAVRPLKKTTAAHNARIFQQVLTSERLPLAQEEYLFHPTRKFRADFAWPEYKVILEVEGGIFQRNKDGSKGGAHHHPSNVRKQMERYNEAAIHGWCVIRVLPADLLKSETLAMLRAVLVENRL